MIELTLEELKIVSELYQHMEKRRMRQLIVSLIAVSFCGILFHAGLWVFVINLIPEWQGWVTFVACLAMAVAGGIVTAQAVEKIEDHT